MQAPPPGQFDWHLHFTNRNPPKTAVSCLKKMDEETPPPVITGEWKCIDDGTGRNVLYVNTVTGDRRRKEPPEYVAERLANGARKFYFKGVCVRCRKKTGQVVLCVPLQPTHVHALMIGATDGALCIFSANYCEDCLLCTTLPQIKRLRGNVAAVYEALCANDVPMTAFFDTQSITKDPDREKR